MIPACTRPPRVGATGIAVAAVLWLLGWSAAASVLAGCSTPQPAVSSDPPTARLTAFRVRADPSVGLNADEGWAGALNEGVTVAADQPFRLRFEVEATASATGGHQFGLQVRRNEGAWADVVAADFPYPETTSPRVSVVSIEAYEHGAETADLLAGSSAPYRAAAGIDLAPLSPPWPAGEDETVQGEWEWPLVIRRFADGAVTNEAGDLFAFRLVDAGGTPVDVTVLPALRLTIPPAHLGGTFVETPGRIGPWEASNGDLYFIIEPTETDNVLMMVKSVDGGTTWHEVDGANRPAADDLEGVASDVDGDTIHILHQTSEQVWYHAFRTSDHLREPDTWTVRDERVATPGEPPTQVASLAARSDGSLVAAYGGPEKIHLRVRSAEGDWGEEVVVDADEPQILSGPHVVLGASDVVHLAYTADDGTAWTRTLQPGGALTPRRQLAAGLGTTEYDVGAILPLIFAPETNALTILYRLASGELWERRIVDGGSLTEPVLVSDRAVVQNAVDSDQAGADAIADGTAVHVLFIEQDSGHILHTHREEGGSWQPATLLVDGVDAQWIRGHLLTRQGGRAYGFVYDGGSDGGSGMNRFGKVPLESEE